jgi:multiple sugar transport system permease protein
MGSTATAHAGRPGYAGRARSPGRYVRRYWVFVVPAATVVVAVIVMPWLFTFYMSAHDWQIGGGVSYVGFANFVHLFTSADFMWSVLRTLYFTVLAVVLPVVLGIAAALCFQQQFFLRGLARTIFILPMMATPVAIALVFVMMFHPQLGVLNYLLTNVGLPPSAWTYSTTTVIPTLVLVETWEWTPLVMLIVLGGLASLPIEPYEAARLDGANPVQMFRHITLPMVWPFIVVAGVIRTIDALKSFDTIYVITQGGPGTASQTINIYLYNEAFAYYHIGYASAVVLVFFVLILAISLVLLAVRQRSQWQ